jgi:hypothetical protein
MERVFSWEDKIRRLLLRFERRQRAALRLQVFGLRDNQPTPLLLTSTIKLLRF